MRGRLAAPTSRTGSAMAAMRIFSFDLHEKIRHFSQTIAIQFVALNLPLQA
jgi:hypothetical protein